MTHEQAEQLGASRLQRLIDRLRPGRVTVKRQRVADDAVPAFPGMGTFSERAAAWQAAHGRDWQIEAWENPSRAARYLESNWCEAHLDGPQQHAPPV